MHKDYSESFQGNTGLVDFDKCLESLYFTSTINIIQSYKCTTMYWHSWCINAAGYEILFSTSTSVALVFASAIFQANTMIITTSVNHQRLTTHLNWPHFADTFYEPCLCWQINYTDLCNQIAFTSMLTLYQCKFILGQNQITKKLITMFFHPCSNQILKRKNTNSVFCRGKKILK